MKRCGKCGDSKPLTEFNRNKARTDGYQHQCRPCQNGVDREFYRANPSRKSSVRGSADAAKAACRSYVTEYLSQHPCVDCGEGDPIVLEFDHVRGEKLGNLSEMINRGASLKRIVAEIEKCDVRCANCHRRITAKRNGAWWKLL
ncbi:HNH endonuclease [Mycobacterium phage MS810]